MKGILKLSPWIYPGRYTRMYHLDVLSDVSPGSIVQCILWIYPPIYPPIVYLCRPDVSPLISEVTSPDISPNLSTRCLPGHILRWISWIYNWLYPQMYPPDIFQDISLDVFPVYLTGYIPRCIPWCIPVRWWLHIVYCGEIRITVLDLLIVLGPFLHKHPDPLPY